MCACRVHDLELLMLKHVTFSSQPIGKYIIFNALVLEGPRGLLKPVEANNVHELWRHTVRIFVFHVFPALHFLGTKILENCMKNY